MSLTTRSQFWTGIEITAENNLINFDEGGGELEAEIDVGVYAPSEIGDAIASALNAAGGFDYTVALNRSTRILTITSSSATDFLAATGTSVALSPWATLGFPATDQMNVLTFAATSACCTQYRPQFILQDHIPTSRNRRAASATVNKSASGRVQVQKFGDERFLQCNIKFITDIPQGPSGSPIETNVTGVDDAIAFMEYAVTKGQVEFMADRDVPTTFELVLLESTPQAADGTGYQLKETYDQGLPYYYETGTLRFRLIED